MSDSEFEYGIRWVALDKEDPIPHRTGMSEDEAWEWVREAEEEMGFRKGAFVVIRRSLGPWQEDVS